MIELTNDQLTIHCPEVHDDARVAIEFQRTLRIPADGREYPLPAGLGPFPLRHVDDFPRTVPARWIEHGGVMLPMYQAEALWIMFHSDYPFAIKVTAGTINAVTGEESRDGLHRDPQDYMVASEQPWLDGYCVARGVIRQFVAMPLGSGYSAEEQITGQGTVGGLQIVAYPLKREAYERYIKASRALRFGSHTLSELSMIGADMGLAPGGRMKQEIYRDKFNLEDWDQRHRARCFVHIANAQQWRAITGEAPPTAPITAAHYQSCGVPWFDYYAADLQAVPGSGILDRLKSLAHMAKDTGQPLADNDPITVERLTQLRRGLRRSEVREGAF
jgi:hypothetical protein